MSDFDHREFLEDAAAIAFIQRARRRRFPAKQTILQPGEPPSSIYLILDGSISVLAENDDGREIILAYKHAGEFFGEMCLFPQLENRSATVRSRTELWVAEMGYSGFHEFSQEFPGIIFLLAGQMAIRLRDTSRRLADLNFLDVAGRVARTLLDLSRKPDAERTALGSKIKISRQEMARIVGCTREMVGRVLKSLEDDGLIKTQGQTILVIDPN